MSDALPLSPDLDARLTALYRTGQQAWPGVPLSAQDFVAHVAERLQTEGAGVGDRELALDEILAGELYLACACARHVPQALSAFESAYLSRVPAMIGHLDASPDFVSEVVQIVRVILFVGSDSQRPAIGDYAGRGALHAFVKIVAVRAALRQRQRRVMDGVIMDHPSGVAELPEPALGPELAHVKARYQSEFKKALEAAMAGLSTRQRNLLRLQLVVGLSGKQIAGMYRVSEATISRWLAAARDAVLEETQRRLTQRMRLSPDEVISLARLIRSQLDLSLSRVLGADPEP